MSAETDRRGQLRDRIGLALLDVAPEGWRRIDLRCRAVVDVHDVTLTVLLEDGSQPDVVIPQNAVDDLLELRRVMYKPNEGTWFSVRILLDPPGRLNANYNFDWDPRWEPGIPPRSWAQDLREFPRDAEHIPGWLRDKLAEAAEEGNQ